jgi:hypothetical protein
MLRVKQRVKDDLILADLVRNTSALVADQLSHNQHSFSMDYASIRRMGTKPTAGRKKIGKKDIKDTMHQLNGQQRLLIII